MSRIITIKITDPKPCLKCERVIKVNEWAMAVIGGFICSTCGVQSAA